MNDRQIQVLEKVYMTLCLMDIHLYPNRSSPYLIELSQIIEDQKEINAKEFSSTRKYN